MREILFRGMTQTNEWIYGSLIFVDEEHTFITPKYEGASTMSCAELVATTMKYVKPNTVGQYTGLTDKNGKKIFEGDIVYVGDSRCPLYIEFTDSEKDNSYMCFSWNCRNANDPYYLHRLENNSSFYEVIGNVHDNPELVEVKNNGT